MNARTVLYNHAKSRPGRLGSYLIRLELRVGKKVMWYITKNNINTLQDFQMHVAVLVSVAFLCVMLVLLLR